MLLPHQFMGKLCNRAKIDYCFFKYLHILGNPEYEKVNLKLMSVCLSLCSCVGLWTSADDINRLQRNSVIILLSLTTRTLLIGVTFASKDRQWLEWTLFYHYGQWIKKYVSLYL